MLDVVTVVDDGDDGRRAPQGVMLAVLSQLLKAFGTTYFLRVTQVFFDIFSDMLSGIRILSHIFSGILSGILSGISSGILCEWGPVGNTLIMNFNMFFLLLLLPLLPVELFSQSVLIVLAENRQIDVLLKLSEHKTP